MRRVILAIMTVLFTVGAASAQNYMVVDSEKVFKSMAEYNSALEQIDNLSKSYQEAVDAKFQEVEKLYNNYMQQRAYLSASSRQQVEQQILDLEAQATAYPEQGL